MGEENDDLVSQHALTKVNVIIVSTNERGTKWRDIYFHFHIDVLAVVQAKRIPITDGLSTYWTPLYASRFSKPRMDDSS